MTNPLSLHPAIAATYVLLALAVVALWFGRYSWVVMLGLAVAAGYTTDVLYGPAALWIGMLAGFCLVYDRTRRSSGSGGHLWAIALSAIGLLGLTALLSVHALPGFHNFKVLDEVVPSEGAAPYSLYLNFDKTAAGICILGLCYQRLLGAIREWWQALKRALPLFAANTAGVGVVSAALSYLQWQPKWTPLFWLWASANLLFTCLAEEALFRGFLQRELTLLLPRTRGAEGLTLAASGISFGAAHFAGGLNYVALATLAGLGYAYVYRKTQSVEMAMLAHFSLNATHFLLFTYPRAL